MLRPSMFFLFSAFIGVGCASKPVPLVAQIGSTFVVPIGSEKQLGLAEQTAYGGGDHTDHQRGALNVRLDHPDTGGPLNMRASSVVLPSHATQIARTGNSTGIGMVFSLIDIPNDNLLVGHHTVYITKTKMDSQVPPVPFEDLVYAFDIDIVDSGTAGVSTPFEWCLPTTSCLPISAISDGVPDPQVVATFPPGLAAVELAVFTHLLPGSAAVIDILEPTFDHLNDRAIVSWVDNFGILTVRVVGNGRDLEELSFVLDIPDAMSAVATPPFAVGTAPYDLPLIYKGAWDANGDAIPGLINQSPTLRLQ